MLSPIFFSFLCLTWTFLSSAATNCPLMGPTFPRPSSLSTLTSIQTAIKNLTTTFAQRDADTSTGGSTNSYSIQVFSASNSTPIFEHYHTATNLASLNSTGVKTVDANTVYRIGSLTKVFTVYTFLIEAGDIHFNDPITNFIPELAAIAANTTGNDITKVSWSEITIGELASHMAGIAADNTMTGEITQTLSLATIVAIGFPPIPTAEIPDCGLYPLCSRAEFFATFSRMYPAFATSETPAYSNVAFQLLSYALENITGRTFQSSLETKVLTPLGLTHTSYSAPNESIGVIPGTLAVTEWGYDFGDEDPAGGMYSSAGDIAALGRSILKSTLLTSAQTRRWLKPATLTSDLRETVGYPWGLRRITLNAAQPYKITTAFNKAGVVGAYSALIALLPDYDIGFTIMVAGDLALSNWVLADIIGNVIVPAAEQAARDQATQLYAGKYSSSSVNSSVTLTTDSSKPGLGISSWISNGTDMMAIANELLEGTVSSSFGIRLYPTDFQVVAADGSKQVAFKAIMEDLATQLVDNMFTAACGTWIGPTSIVYGSQALDQFVFSIDASGKVVSVESMALRLPLKKV